MRSKRILLTLVAVLVVAQTNAYAYTDPGSGMLIWQILAGAAIGLMFYIRRIMVWARGLMASRKTASHAGAPASGADNESSPVEG